MSDTETVTGVVNHWDEAWSNDAGREDWIKAEADVRAVVPILKERETKTALDLGCGVGRHAIYLAGQGFDVSGLDASPKGLEYAEAEAEKAGVSLELTQSNDLADLPYEDQSFDYVLSWNVIYHADTEQEVKQFISEIHRILKPGGIYQGTMLSKRNKNCGEGNEISPGVWLNAQANDDKNHPHYFCDCLRLVELFDGFETLMIKDEPQKTHSGWHWSLVMEKV